VAFVSVIDSEGAMLSFGKHRLAGADYGSHTFYFERDIVFTLPSNLAATIDAQRLPFWVYNDYSIIPRQYRHLSVDLACECWRNAPMMIARKYIVG
jgi:hypothetical protein